MSDRKKLPEYFWPLIAGLAIRLILPWYNHGFKWMDEHWQVIEPANFLIHGIWSKAYEWDVGLRSWIYPWLVSWPMRFAEAIGVQEPVQINAFARVAHGLVSTLAIPLTFIATRKLTSRAYALGAAWLVALWPFSVYCGIHTHNEMAGAIFILAAVAAPILLKSENIAYLVAGFFFGLGISFKIDLAVCGLGYGLWQLFHLKVRRSILLFAGVLPPVIFAGYIDFLTWGHWFHSSLGRYRVNIVEEVGNQWGVSPWYTHIIYYFDIAALPSLIAILVLPWVWKKLPDVIKSVWFMNVLFVAIHCTIPHKEKRFLSPLTYTAQLTAFVTLYYYAREKSFFMALGSKKKLLGYALGLVFVVHFILNARGQWINRPWWNRIQAVQTAGKIPGIQKMISAEWPVTFYLPRHVPSIAIEATQEKVREATEGLTDIGLAYEWDRAALFQNLGFVCEGWPKPRPVSKDPVPWAFHCVRPKAR